MWKKVHSLNPLSSYDPQVSNGVEDIDECKVEFEGSKLFTLDSNTCTGEVFLSMHGLLTFLFQLLQSKFNVLNCWIHLFLEMLYFHFGPASRATVDSESIPESVGTIVQ